MRTLLACAAVMACAACQQPAATAPAAVDTTAEADAIKETEQAQISAIEAKDTAAATANYADDAVFVGEDGKAVEGSKAIGEVFGQFLKDPALAFDYTQGKTVVSDGGDMAYSTATYTETITDPKSGKPVTMKGSNLSVWQKGSDGRWKLVADSNAGAPAS